MTCHEKLMRFFFLFIQEVTRANTAHLVPWLGLGVHFLLQDFAGPLQSPPTANFEV